MCKRCFDRGCSFDAKKTKKIIQPEYEGLYLGSVFQIENRYSVLISMFFIILMYSTTVPILYVYGAILCFVQYWMDKYLFLRHYRKPPNYGLGLARYARQTIEWALLIHLLMGLYMMSDPEIFPVYHDEENKVLDGLQKYAKFVGDLVSWIIGVESDRFY